MRELEHSIIFIQHLTYAPLGYRLFQIHFHWGVNNTEGSEHTINGERYPLEAHLVHYNSRFPSIDAAVRSNEPDALVVISILFELGSTTPPSISKVLERLAYFRSVGNEIEIDEYLNLADMFPPRLEYFTYLGSFTTPRCNECNRWIVLARPVSITQEALDKIRSVYINLSATRTGVGRNFRPVQPLNGRRVTSSFAMLPNLPTPTPTPPPAMTPTPTPTPNPEAFE
jgi:carbonic anhydrase